MSKRLPSLTFCYIGSLILLSGCVTTSTLPEMAWVRTDGRKIADDPALLQQGKSDIAACDANLDSGTPTASARGCMAQKGYVLVQRDHAEEGEHQVGRDSDTSKSLCVLLRHMTRITYLDGLSSETEPIRLCRRKAAECQRTALTTIDPNIRLKFTHLAKLWREMADEAARTNVASTSEERGVVVFLNQFQKSK